VKNITWAEQKLLPSEEARIRQHVALIVGYDTTAGKVRSIGSGILVGSPILYVLTAAHLLSGFMMQVVVEAPDGAMHVCEITGVTAALAKEGLDLALLRLDLTDSWFAAHTMAPLMMDFEDTSLAESYLMAGFTEMPSLSFEDQDRVVEMRARSKFVVRASRIDEVTTPLPGTDLDFRMWKVQMPSEPGMSGGPLIRNRRPWGDRKIPSGNLQLFTAVGVTSRGLTDAQGEGYTWVSPATGLRPLQADFGGFGALFSVETMIITYQDMEGRFADIDLSRPDTMHLLDPIPIYREKCLRATAQPTDAYLRVLDRGPPFDIDDLPADRRLLGEVLGLRLRWTTDEATRAVLEGAFLTLAQFQPADLPDRTARVLEDEKQIRALIAQANEKGR
jgi:hypothetical protein